MQPDFFLSAVFEKGKKKKRKTRVSAKTFAEILAPVIHTQVG